MKVILLFALFGLSFGSNGDVGDGTKCPVNPKAKVHNCLIQALTEFGYLFPAIGNYVCAYIKFEEDHNVENYNIAVQAFINFLECTNCQFDNYLDKDQTLQNLFLPIGGTGSEALEVAITILQKLGIDELKMKLICLLNIADILTDLDYLYCKLKNRGPTDADEDAAAASAAAGLTAIFKKLQCVLEKELGLKDGELEKALGDLGPDLLEKLVFNLFLSGKVDLINTVICAGFDPPVPGIDV
ncbi:uncharacterized protein [Aquarana catesbeiana]|uniref:uncharacterized protein isoform X2 n=1 Tax=Aquarana catesbeiana TaxID=8400 RepID=UPI003CC93541